MKNNEITNPGELEDAVQKTGFLPFFRNAVGGFSLEERCPRRLWFTSEPGPWEWKGPVVRGRKCAYGKFFRGKAVYVSLQMLPHLCNYRRDGYDFDARCDDGLVFYRDREIYETIAEHGSISSKELRRIVPGDDTDKYLTRLQMQTYIVTEDFYYEKDKNGKEYGWGVARYATLEYVFGKDAVRSAYGVSPEESFKIMKETILAHFPGADPDKVAKLIK
ncbi:MAG: hypothetical protein J5879_00855 [Clostridia bacterium]|nr:hypothetical protein [Clostridia bacterium]